MRKSALTAFTLMLFTGMAGFAASPDPQIAIAQAQTEPIVARLTQRA